MPHKVLQASPQLFEHLEELENELFDNSFNARTLEREFAQGGEIWVIGDPLEGYMLVRSERGLADILRLGVRKSYQGKGRGTQLLQLALSTFPKLMLSVRKGNLGAIRLYTRSGLKVQSDLGNSWVMVTCDVPCTVPHSGCTSRQPLPGG